MNAITPIPSTAVLVLTPEAEEMNRRLGLTIAERFEKRHSEVQRSVDLLVARRPELALRNFAEESYTTPQTGRQLHRRFPVDRDGFMLLGMGFTGDGAIG